MRRTTFWESARARSTDNASQPTAHARGIQKMTSFSVCRVKAHGLPQRCTAKEERSLGVCAHLHRLWRRLVKKISAKACSGKEIAGLKKKKKKKNMMTRKS